MTTEDPVRFVSCGIRNLPTVDEALASSSDVPQVLDLLLKEQRFNRNNKDAVPNRSGSAPPSLEGSFTALGSFSGPFHSVLGDKLLSANIKDVHELEKQLRADPSYITYYFSNVNLNPRLPPPITSRETRHLAKNVGQLGKYWRYPSFDGNSEGSLFSSQALLSTHEEEDEDDSSLICNLNGFQSSQSGTPSEGRRENLIDLIEEVLPRTPSPLSSNYSHSASHGLGEIVIDSEAQVNRLQDFHSTTFQAASPRVCAGNATQSGHSVIPTLKANPSVSTVSSMPSSSMSRHECTMGELNMHSNSQYPTQHSRKTTLDQQTSAFQCHASTSHTKSQSQEVPLSHNMTANGQQILSSVDGKQSLEPAGYYPYVGSTGYTYPGNSLYPNLLASSLFAPQYGLGGYAAAATISPAFSVGYPPPGAICMAFGSPMAMSISPMGAGEFFSSNADIQHKFHGQLGVSVQLSSFPSLYLPYFEQPPIVGYDAFGQSVVHNYNLQEPPLLTAYSIDRLSCPRSNTAVSPAVGTSPIRRTENIRLRLNSSQTNGLQGSRGRERINTNKVFSFLEELKSSKNCKFELSDIIGHVIEFSTDQHGSRFIQQKLENCCVDEKAHVFEEVLSHAPMLMTDVFGNYVVQKLFEHADEGQRKELANQLIGHILPLSLQMYGCRVIQKALEVIEDDQKKKLVLELKGHVLQCVWDQNGNHVIQKCIQCVPTDQIGFVISAFQGQVATLSMHPYGCRVIQRVLENCTDESQCQSIVNEILHSACLLAQDQYGNYVTQHLIERGKPQERSQIITKLAGQIIHMSQNKYASNVIEKCLEHGDSAERDLLIEEIVGQTEGNEDLLVMMKDQYANYVIQKTLESCSGKQYNILLFRIKAHLQALKKYNYGKHIVARVEGLFSEESGASSQ